MASATGAAGASKTLRHAGRIFANPDSGPRSVSIEDLSSLFPDDDVERMQPDRLAARIEAAIGDDRQVRFVGIAGGDGTVRSAAGVLSTSASETPLLVVPTGTRNHFGGDLGIGTVDTAVATAAKGVVRSVDVGRVNDARFVNNSSVGTYPNLVLERDQHERRLPKRLGSIVAAWKQLRRGHRMTVEVDGAAQRVWAVFVGNNCYGDTVIDLTGRQRLDEGVLDVRIVRAGGKLSRLRIAGAVLFGRVGRSPLIDRRSVSSVTIDAHGPVEVALDGEVEMMASPLHYRSCPRALRVLVPRDGGGEVSTAAIQSSRDAWTR